MLCMSTPRVMLINDCRSSSGISTPGKPSQSHLVKIVSLASSVKRPSSLS